MINANVQIIKHGIMYDPVKFTCPECYCEFIANCKNLPGDISAYAICPECGKDIDEYEEVKFDFYNQK